MYLRSVNTVNKTYSSFFLDLNVEHAQLLVFLFHSLPLMQKKLLLLQLGQCIVNVTTILEKG